MKATMALTAIEGEKDKSWTFILFQSPTKKLLKVKKFEGEIADAVFLEEEKAQNFKIYLRMVAGCYYLGSNVEENFQRFFRTQQFLKEIHLELDGVTVQISKKNMDVVQLYKQYRKAKSEQEKQREILEFRNQKLTMQQEQERRKMRDRWLKAIRR